VGEVRNAYKILVGKSEGKRPLGSMKCGTWDSTKKKRREVGCEDVDWIY
jgi:hypothetical protein